LKQNGTAAYNQLQRGTLRVNTHSTSTSSPSAKTSRCPREQAYGGLDDNALGEGNIVGKNILMQPVCRSTTSTATSRRARATGLGNNTNPLKYTWARRFDRNINDRAIGNVFGRFAVLPTLYCARSSRSI